MKILLRIGARDLPAHDQALLRSLIQLLNGHMRCQPRFHEPAEECDVVFVPATWHRRMPASCITVRVAEAGAMVQADDADGFALEKPLRHAAVHAVLQVASELIANSTQAAAADGVRAVFLALTRHLMSRERRTTVLRLSDGHGLLVDFARQAVHADMTRQELLRGMYVMQPPQRAQPADEAQLGLAPGWPLRELVWELAAHLGDADVEGTDFQAAYRLVRRPAGGLPQRPEYQRLVGQMLAQALTLDEACRHSGATRPQVQWFLEACFAMGLITPAGEGATLEPAAGGTGEPPALLGRIGQRLRLWQRAG